MADGINTTGDPIQGIISAIVGDPAIASALSNIIRMGMGDAMTANMRLGGENVPYGPNSVFGPQNVGLNAASFMRDQAISANMQQAASMMESKKLEQRESYQRFMGANPAMAGALASHKFNATNFVSDLIFSNSQPLQMMAGLEQAMQYQGGGTPTMMLSGAALARQERANTNMSDMGQILMADFVTNTGKYGGLKGQDVGRVTAELSRTGQLAQFVGGGDLSADK